MATDWGQPALSGHLRGAANRVGVRRSAAQGPGRLLRRHQGSRDASGWQILFKVTIPKVRWGLLYGVVLCNARAMGEFGAVSVVSGHIRGLTNTVPLHVEILYNEYNMVGAFAVASILTLLALATLG